MNARRSLKFGQIRPPTVELAAIERLKKKIPIDLQCGKRCFQFSLLCLIGSFSYLQVTMTYIRARMFLKFGQI